MQFIESGVYIPPSAVLTSRMKAASQWSRTSSGYGVSTDQMDIGKIQQDCHFCSSSIDQMLAMPSVLLLWSSLEHDLQQAHLSGAVTGV